MPDALWKIATANKKGLLTNAAYKDMKNLKNTQWTFKNLSLAQFKNAFHSKKTPPEIRNLLLNMAFSRDTSYKRRISWELGLEKINLSLKPVNSKSGVYIDFLELPKSLTNKQQFKHILQEFQVEWPNSTLINKFLKHTTAREQKAGFRALKWGMGFNNFFNDAVLTIKALVKLTDYEALFDPYEPEDDGELHFNYVAVTKEEAYERLEDVRKQLISIKHTAQGYNQIMGAFGLDERYSLFETKINDLLSYLDVLKTGGDVSIQHIHPTHTAKYESDIKDLNPEDRNFYIFNLSLASLGIDFMELIKDMRGVKVDLDLLGKTLEIHGNRKPPKYIRPNEIWQSAEVSPVKDVQKSFNDWMQKAITENMPKIPKSFKLWEDF